jgi:hypothetical protein
MSNRWFRLATLALVVSATMAGECDPKDAPYFGLIGGGGNLTGTVTGLVTVDGTGEPGVAVTLREGSTTIDTETTGASGTFTFSNVAIGMKIVEIDEPAGTDCDQTERTVNVTTGGTAQANFACETPEPQTGTVTGTVTVNGSGESGVTVTLREGTTVIGTTTTGTGGTYSFTNVATGTKNVSIATPDGATCDDDAQDVDVPAGGTATANFACTRPASGFTITFAMPAPGYCHIALGDTRTYTGIWTDPAQPGASYSFSWSGPGTVGGTTRSGSLDAAGGAFDEQMINQFGMYTGMASVTVGGNTETASTTVNVTSAQGACQQISSLRYKQGVVALLPDDVRPLGLRPVAFRYVRPWGDPAEARIGLIAEEVVEVFPEAVLRDAEGEPNAIDYRILSGEVAEALVGRSADAVEAAIARLAGDR